jgi:hypothetical protein
MGWASYQFETITLRIKETYETYKCEAAYPAKAKGRNQAQVAEMRAMRKKAK